MATVVGYIRHYRRRDGSPGHTPDEQKAWVREIARERDMHRGARWRYMEEWPSGSPGGWPILSEAIEQAELQDFLVVVPTLDGVRCDLSFLELLADCRFAVYVRCGWRRPGVIAKDTNYKYRSNAAGWLLSRSDEAKAFAEMVARVRRWRHNLAGRIRAGLARAKEDGKPIGAQREGCYRFTKDQQRQGGKTTADKRRGEANLAYRGWVREICHRREQLGQSYERIAKYLAENGARTPDGRKIGPMLISRIYQRELLRAPNRLAALQ